jgi:hypothetical protein
MKKLLQLAGAAAFLCAQPVSSQNSDGQFWSPVNERKISVTGQRQIVPKKYLTYQLTGTALKNALFAAPNDKDVRIGDSRQIVSIPAPDGSMQKFKVVESPVMAPELAASFPDIKTFSIKGIDDPYATGKLDWNEFGFHGMVLSPNGDYFIDPFCNGNTKDYITYYTKDFEKDPAHKLPEAGVITDSENQKSTPTPQKKSESGAAVNKGVPAVCVGTQLRTYRLAVATTGEYAVAAVGTSSPTLAQTLAKVVTSVNRVDGVYEKEVAVRMVLVPSSTLVIYTNGATDSFTGTANSNANQLINLSQSVITASIGTANFDIGHTFSTGGGGLANLGCVCSANNKARGITGSPFPVGDPYDIDYVAHEMGHQFGGNHTFNAISGSCAGNRNPSTSVEPGSGITIMAYAGICGSNDLASNSIAYFHAISYDEIVNFTQTGGGSGCPVITTSGNNPPVVIGSGNYFIPKSTPFVLTGSATDPDGDPLTYSWEETDAGTAGANWNSGTRPFFRSYTPTTTPTRFFPNATVVASGNYTITKGEFLPKTSQFLSFRLTARDNKMGGGGVCYANSQITVDTAGPFKVLVPSNPGINWPVNSQQMVTWDPAFTDQAPVSCDSVRILISYNSGATYSVWVNSTPNFGFKTVTVPSLQSTTTTCRVKIEAIGNVFYDIGDNNFTISTGSVTAISPVSANNPVGLTVWPNPAQSELHFSANGLNNQLSTEVAVIDLLGSVVKRTVYENRSSITETIDLSQLNKGVYFVRVSNDGKQSLHRIVKD